MQFSRQKSLWLPATFLPVKHWGGSTWARGTVLHGVRGPSQTVWVRVNSAGSHGNRRIFRYLRAVPLHPAAYCPKRQSPRTARRRGCRTHPARRRTRRTIAAGRACHTASERKRRRKKGLHCSLCQQRTAGRVPRPSCLRSGRNRRLFWTHTSNPMRKKSEFAVLW